MRYSCAKRISLWLIVVMVCSAMTAPAWASPISDTPKTSDTAQTIETPSSTIDQEDPRAAEIVSISGYEKLTVAELNDKVKECRQALLETRLEVVRKANEAKQRLEELIKSDRIGTRSADSLRKDLETIKEAQRVLATILSDIVSITAATVEQTASNNSSDAGQMTAATPTGETEVGPGAGASVLDAQNASRQGLILAEFMPSREYLEGLITLFNAKIRQLVRIAASLDSVLMIG